MSQENPTTEEADKYFHGEASVEPKTGYDEVPFVVPEDPEVLKKEIKILKEKIGEGIEKVQQKAIAHAYGVPDAVLEEHIKDADVILKENKEKLQKLEQALQQKKKSFSFIKTLNTFLGF